MARDWQTLFGNWAKPPSDTEETKAANAAKMIRQAIDEFAPLKSRGTSVYATGSYRNNTNTRLESDIDVAVVLTDCHYSECPSQGPPQASDLGHGGGVSYGLNEFRKDVGAALRAKFGSTGVTQGSKAFDVHSNSARLDADVPVFLEHRRYTGKKNQSGGWHFLLGVEMRGSDGKRIINWHEQHYQSGVAKNDATGRRFKRIVRILKRLREDMKASGTQAARDAANNTPSFLVECLVYNASNGCFQQTSGSYVPDVKACLEELWRNTKPGEDHDFVEVSGLKWLFSGNQPWTQQGAHSFLLEAWRHAGFGR